MQAVPPPIPDDDNPYRAPQAELAKPRDALHLATRTQRLGAAVLDNLMVAAIGIGAALLMPLAEDNPNRQIVFVGFVVLAVLALLAVNLAGIYRSGQTLGKRPRRAQRRRTLRLRAVHLPALAGDRGDRRCAADRPVPGAAERVPDLPRESPLPA